jgi:hypothetical protein
MKNNTHLAMTIAKRAVWDLSMQPQDFLLILRGELTVAWPSRAFCVARLLECANWYDVTTILSPREICSLWPNAQQYVRSLSIRRGMDYACRILQ